VRQWLCESYQIASSGISTGASLINIDLGIVINRRVEEVWNGLTSPSIAERWMSGVLHASVITDGAWAVGAQFRKVQRFMGLRTEMVYDLVTYEPNTKLAYRTVSGTLSGPLFYEASITLEAAGSGTKLSYEGRGELRGLFKVVEPLFTRLARRRFERDFNTFKNLIERAR
jgi:carbon monoxide dehydrogenase subunit G